MSALYARAIGAVVLVVALLVGWHFLTAHYDHRGYERRKAEDAAAADAQTASNRDLQRAAEKRYVVQTETRDRFIVQTVKEVRHETENLAACVLTDGAVRRLHDAAACARADSAAACGAGEPVPEPR